MELKQKRSKAKLDSLTLSINNTIRFQKLE